MLKDIVIIKRLKRSPTQLKIFLSIKEPSTPETREPRMYSVSYKNGVFSPTNLRIHAGDTVRFKNEGLFGIRILSGSYIGFDSIGDIPQGSYFSFTFAAKGIFDYSNNKNPDEKGTIIVR